MTRHPTTPRGWPHRPRRLIRTGAALLTGGALLAAPTAWAAPAAATTPTQAGGPRSVAAADPAPVGPGASPEQASRAAAGWLARQLVDGTHLTSSGYVDYGLTADAILAFDAAGVASGQAAAATSYLVDHLPAYVGDGTDESYAGALAKAALVLLAAGEDPPAAGGVDLLARLGELEQGPGDPQPGRFSDRSSYGDYSNTIGQALAVLALHRAAGVDPSGSAVTALTGQQCDDGGLRLTFPDPQAADTGCVSDPDATALAVPALLAVGQVEPAAAALDYLTERQGADGGVANTGPGATPNTNTTGLAAAAFAAAGRTAPAAAAVRFLTSAQQDCSAPAARVGAIAYTPGDFDATTAVRATAQAVLGLAGTSYAEVTAAGASAEVPTVTCPTTTPSPSTPTEAGGGTATGTTGQPAAAGAGTGAGSPVETLPATGPSGAARTALVGALLTAAGAAALWTSRRRGSAEHTGRSGGVR